MAWNDASNSTIVESSNKTVEAIDNLNRSVKGLDNSTTRANWIMIILTFFMLILSVAIFALTYVMVIQK